VYTPAARLQKFHVSTSEHLQRASISPCQHACDVVQSSILPRSHAGISPLDTSVSPSLHLGRAAPELHTSILSRLVSDLYEKMPGDLTGSYRLEHLLVPSLILSLESISLASFLRVRGTYLHVAAPAAHLYSFIPPYVRICTPAELQTSRPPCLNVAILTTRVTPRLHACSTTPDLQICLKSLVSPTRRRHRGSRSGHLRGTERTQTAD